jgi:hypothetical protein
MSNANDRFEAIGALYYRRYLCLRPGKSVSPEAGYDSMSDENREQFDQWFATQAFTDAIDRIISLEEQIERNNES